MLKLLYIANDLQVKDHVVRNDQEGGQYSGCFKPISVNIEILRKHQLKDKVILVTDCVRHKLSEGYQIGLILEISPQVPNHFHLT